MEDLVRTKIATINARMAEINEEIAVNAIGMRMNVEIYICKRLRVLYRPKGIFLHEEILLATEKYPFHYWFPESHDSIRARERYLLRELQYEYLKMDLHCEMVKLDHVIALELRRRTGVPEPEQREDLFTDLDEELQARGLA